MSSNQSTPQQTESPSHPHWVGETYQDVIQFNYRITKTLYHQRSSFQDIKIVDSVRMGRMLLLDDCMMTTEADEFVYHEMITHPALIAHPKPESVLIIGGGDGGTVREVLKHPSVQRIVLAEIDGDVINVCKEYLPAIACGLDDPRVTIEVGDGFAYVNKTQADFDLILVDSTDPVGPGQILFSPEFYQSVFKALKPDGIMVNQTESPFAQSSELKPIFDRLKDIFPIVRPYTGSIPTYPFGFWSWTFCSKQYMPTINLRTDAQAELSKHTQYYNAGIHQAAFALPNFYQRKLGLL
jgi:spermidine synthase